jgi:DNA-binding XRE family transcriptional regulator
MSLIIVYNNRVAEKIEEFQKKHGSSKTWIANKAGMSKQTLNSIENINNPTVQSLIRLAYVLNCKVEDLYSYDLYEQEEFLR